jgi:isopentenyl diphosphate isomerase/L-lactate dehydrogenase-like FMN-dependent dehydrogenase
MASLLDPGLSWADVDWLRGFWKGPLLLKGILHPAEAGEAVARGVDGIIVSNHGGRQLDGALASIDALGEIASEVGSRLTILTDSGYRTGTDIAKALVLGASSVQVGRATLYAAAVAGEDGVFRCLEILRNELDVAMALLGARNPHRIGSDRIRGSHAPDMRRPQTHPTRDLHDPAPGSTTDASPASPVVHARTR